MDWIGTAFSFCIADSGDPEAIEYGDFDEVHNECKDNCTRKRSSDHE